MSRNEGRRRSQGGDRIRDQINVGRTGDVVVVGAPATHQRVPVAEDAQSVPGGCVAGTCSVDRPSRIRAEGVDASEDAIDRVAPFDRVDATEAPVDAPLGAGEADAGCGDPCELQVVDQVATQRVAVPFAADRTGQTRIDIEHVRSVTTQQIVRAGGDDVEGVGLAVSLQVDEAGQADRHQSVAVDRAGRCVDRPRAVGVPTREGPTDDKRLERVDVVEFGRGPGDLVRVTSQAVGRSDAVDAHAGIRTQQSQRVGSPFAINLAIERHGEEEVVIPRTTG